MSTIHVEVTAAHIAACAVVPDIGDGFKSTHPDGKDPVELAIAAVVGQEVMCDQDVPGEMATFGQGRNTLVLNLPPEVTAFIDRYYQGMTVEPFGFDMEIEAWLVALVRDPRPYLTLREAAGLREAVEASMNDVGLGTKERLSRARQRIRVSLDSWGWSGSEGGTDQHGSEVLDLMTDHIIDALAGLPAASQPTPGTAE